MAKAETVRETHSIEKQNAGTQTFLGGIRLNSRVGLFVFIGILSLAAIGGVLFNAEQRLKIALSSLTSSYLVASLSFRAETAILALNTDSQNFLVSNKMIYGKNYSRKSSEAAILLTNLLHLPAASDGQSMIKALIEGVTMHATHFQNTLQVQSLIGTDTDTGLAAKTSISGSKLQTKVLETRNIKLINEINTLRKLELKLLGPSSQENAQKILGNLKIFRQSLVASRLPGPVKRVINSRIRSYGSDLESLAQIRLGQIKEIARMDEVNTLLGQNLESLVTFTSTLSKGARESFKSKQIEIRNIVAGISALIILLFTVTGAILMRSIVYPVKSLAEAAMRLARGDESVFVPAAGNQDETGEVAIALTYFRENMIEANTLRKELEYYLKDPDLLNESQNQVPLESDDEAGQPLADIDLAEASKNVISPELESLNTDSISPKTDQNLFRTETLKDPDLKELDLHSREDGKDQILQSTPISEASQLVAQTGQNASSAARDAERCDVMIKGLLGASKKIKDIELLLESINDHMSLLAVQTAITNEKGIDNSNNVKLESKIHSDQNQEQNPNEFVADNLDTLQNGTKRAIRAIRQVGETIQEVNQVAVEIAADASSDALEAATMLLQQSENLRGMLDGLLEKIKPGDITKSNN